MKLLECVVAELKNRGYSIGNIDATLIAQRPKIKPYISEMRENIASVCSIDTEFVNVKATTEEKLGFTGNLEGMSAHAVCIISKD